MCLQHLVPRYLLTETTIKNNNFFRLEIKNISLINPCSENINKAMQGILWIWRATLWKDGSLELTSWVYLKTKINHFLFSSQAERDLWWSKLAQLTSLEREHSPAGASINITYFDNSTNFEHVSYNNYNYDNNDNNIMI